MTGTLSSARCVLSAERTKRAAPAKDRSYEWHEEEYQAMKRTKLPDGCSSQDYADKCNKLLVDHLRCGCRGRYKQQRSRVGRQRSKKDQPKH
eukprot:2886826-Prymnesium_polylepis.1